MLVCTRERMEQLARCLASIAELRVPAGTGMCVAVADNNPEPREAAIREMGAMHDLELHYGHESRRGYSSVRNRAIELALAAGADLLILVDDDSTVLPDLVDEHIAALERHGADVVVGSFEGLAHRAIEGQRMKKAGTGNVAMRRWLVDAAVGAGLRFDPRLDLLGFEDHEFFRDVVRAGGIVVRSARPLARDERSPGFSSAPPMPAAARRAFAFMEGRNEIVVARLRHGLATALARLAMRMTPQLARAASAYLQSVGASRGDAARADELRQRAALHLRRATGAPGGVLGRGYDRPASKEGRLVELPGTGYRDLRADAEGH